MKKYRNIENIEINMLYFVLLSWMVRGTKLKINSIGKDCTLDSCLQRVKREKLFVVTGTHYNRTF